MTSVGGNDFSKIKLGSVNGQEINLKSSENAVIKKNDINKSIFEKFDINKDNKLDKNEMKALNAFLQSTAGEDNILSQEEAENSGLFDKLKAGVDNFFFGVTDIYNQAGAEEIDLQAQQADEAAKKEEEATETKQETANNSFDENNPIELPELVVTPEMQNSTKLKVNYKDTWYGIVQAKYGITDHKQTMEIIRQLKAENNVNPKATNMPSEIELLNKVTLKDGTEIELQDIDAEVDKSFWKAAPTTPPASKVVSKTGRYTITKNGVTKYYAADGTELKQSYYEAKEAAEGARQKSKNGSGRYTYTASNGETWYFAADGTPIKKSYYERRENEYGAVKAQKNTVKNARAAFKQQLDSDGWAGKTADAVSVLWGSKNRASKVEEDLNTYENQVNQLQKAQAKGASAFSAKFKEIYGVEYNPANVAAYEANPTEENYRKAYGTKNNIHKRVMDYNKSQQDGAAAVKTTAVIAASAAAAVATGGTSLLATAAIAGASTAAARMTVEVADLATNNIDGDVNMENLNNIAEQAAIEGTISAATAGLMKGTGGYLGKAIPKATPKSSFGATPKTVAVRSEVNSATTKSVAVRSNAATSSVVKAEVNTAGSAAGKTTANAAGKASTNTSASGAKASANTSSTSAKAAATENASASASASTKANTEFVNNMAAKVSARGGLNNLTTAEKSKLSEIIGKQIDEIATMSKRDLVRFAAKFHPDKNPGDKLSEYVFTILMNIK